MELTATITTILPLQSGTSKTGNEWKKQDIIIQQEDNAKPVCVSLWGDKVNESLKQGDKARIQFNLESREFNGKWYTDVRAWKVELLNGVEQEQSQSSTPTPTPTNDAADLDALFEGGSGDLPF